MHQTLILKRGNVPISKATMVATGTKTALNCGNMNLA